MRGKFILYFIFVLVVSSLAYAQSVSVSSPAAVDVGNPVQADVTVASINGLFGYQVDIAFDPTVLTFLNAVDGGFIGSGCSSCLFFNYTLVPTNDQLSVISVRLDTVGVNAPGTLFSANFNAINPGTSQLHLTNVQLSDLNGINMTATLNDGSATVNALGTVLTLFDDTDPPQSRTVFPGDFLNFSAAYELTNGNPITGATCLLSFDNFQTSGTMAYDATGGIYRIEAAYGLSGTIPWEVNCNGDLASDTVLISPSPCTDNDGDGYGNGCSLGLDCNDNNFTINPGVAEICTDTVDNNCDGNINENCNQPPTMTPVPNQQVDEGAIETHQIVASDLDLDPLTYSLGGLSLAWITVDSSGLIAMSPPLGTTAQVYPGIIARVNDGNGGQTSSTFSITVGDVNQPPSWTTPPPLTSQVNESQLITFTIAASDPDGDALTYSKTNTLPTQATLGSSSGVFSWTPSFGDDGSYPVTFSANDGNGGVVSRAVTITVGDVNRPPYFNNLVGNQQVDENAQLTFQVDASDDDGDILTYTMTGNVPGDANLNPNTGAFSWDTTFGDAGNYNINLIADDNNGGVASEPITINVGNVNQLPTITNPIGPQQVDEGQTINLQVDAFDADLDTLSYSMSGDTDPDMSLGPNTGAFSWTPSFGDSGNYNINFIVNDGNGGQAQDPVTITVGNVNRNPRFNTPLANQQVDEGNTVSFQIDASDPDGDTLTYTMSGQTHQNMGLDPNTGFFSWTTGFGDSQNYQVTFTVLDGNGGAVVSTITITVGDVNRNPTISPPIGDRAVDENENINFTISASDPDGDVLSYSMSGDTNNDMNLNPNTGFFTWTTTFGDSNNYNINFIVDDGNGGQAQETVTITVGNVNRPPNLNTIGDQSVLEGETLNFTVTASDPDQDPVTLSVSGDPLDSSFDPQTGSFIWTPLLNDSGVYQNIVFTASDGTDTAIETITITVGNVNQVPTLNSIGNRLVNVSNNLNFTVSGFDPDGDALTYGIEGLPTGADFTNQLFDWTPTIDGNYEVNFTLSDGIDLVRESIIITVGNVNRPPQFQAIGNPNIEIGENITIVVSASDPDGDTLTYSATNSPTGATFNPTTRTFFWLPPDSFVAGVTSANATITFTVTDHGNPQESDSSAITITVTNSSSPNQCSDGTSPDTCSVSNQPLYCDNTLALIPDCSNCGCPSGLQCSSGGTCVTPPPTRSTPSGGGGGGGGGGGALSLFNTPKPEPEECNSEWTCGRWGECEAGVKRRTCTDANSCGDITTRPLTLEQCAAACDDGVMNADESGIDCGGSCTAVCNDIGGRIGLTLSSIHANIETENLFTVDLENMGDEILQKVKLRLDELGLEQDVGALLPNEQASVTMRLDALELFNIPQLTVQAFEENVLVGKATVSVSTEVPDYTAVLRKEGEQLISYIVLDNRNNKRRNGLEIELTVTRDGIPVYTEYIGPISAEADSIMINSQEFIDLALGEAEYKVQSTLYEKGRKQKESLTTVILSSEGKFRFSAAGTLLLFLIILGSVGAFFLLQEFYDAASAEEKTIKVSGVIINTIKRFKFKKR